MVKIYRGSFEEIPRLAGSWAVTLGTFDGVHRGHAAICARAVEAARSGALDGTLAVTFARHPRAVLTPQHRPRLLTTLQERIPLLRASGLDRLYILDFDENLRVLEYDQFVRRVLRDQLGMAHFILGHDVHFGRERGGTLESLRRLAGSEGFTFSQVESVRYKNAGISSSRIRDKVGAGELSEAAAMLGHPYLVSGWVEEGRGFGRRLGFATANLRRKHPAKLLPPGGVYSAWTRVAGDENWIPSVLNLGHAPSVQRSAELRLEVHLLEGSPDLYNKQLTLAFGPWLREERRFQKIEDLVTQIGQDVVFAREALDNTPPAERPASLGPGWTPQ